MFKDYRFTKFIKHEPAKNIFIWEIEIIDDDFTQTINCEIVPDWKEYLSVIPVVIKIYEKKKKKVENNLAIFLAKLIKIGASSSKEIFAQLEKNCIEFKPYAKQIKQLIEQDASKI